MAQSSDAFCVFSRVHGCEYIGHIYTSGRRQLCELYNLS